MWVIIPWVISHLVNLYWVVLFILQLNMSNQDCGGNNSVGTIKMSQLANLSINHFYSFIYIYKFLTCEEKKNAV